MPCSLVTPESGFRDHVLRSLGDQIGCWWLNPGSYVQGRFSIYCTVLSLQPKNQNSEERKRPYDRDILKVIKNDRNETLYGLKNPLENQVRHNLYENST